MSNSPDDPRLTPGHPEFVQRPDQPWLKTVAKQIVEIEKLKADNAKLRELLGEGIALMPVIDDFGDVRRMSLKWVNDCRAALSEKGGNHE